MSISTILPFLTAAVMVVFTVMVLQRYIVRRQLHHPLVALCVGRQDRRLEPAAAETACGDGRALPIGDIAV